MKAAVINKFGDPDVFVIDEVETPRPRPGHILIKVLAAGVNRIDHYIREGSVTPELPFPHILGSDAAGEVAALGEGVTGFSVGDRVVPMPGYAADESDHDVNPPSAAASFVLKGLHESGTYGQYAEVPAAFVLEDDTGLKPEEVATLPMVALTGTRALRVGEVDDGDTVLITAGGSGVGTFQIQAAKALGARVATTVRNADKGEYARSLGADLVINSREEDLAARVMEWTGGRGVDAVIDNVGGELLARGLDALKTQGILVAIGFVAGEEVTFNIKQFFFANKQLRGSLMGGVEDLKWALEQVKAGKIRPNLDRALPLAQADEAHRLLSNNQVTGNLVLLPWA